jgi:ERCC4-related helicase
MKAPPDASEFGRDAAEEVHHEEPFRLRSYQAEMVLESMASNIICVMDTGSGKTHM